MSSAPFVVSDRVVGWFSVVGFLGLFEVRERYTRTPHRRGDQAGRGDRRALSATVRGSPFSWEVDEQRALGALSGIREDQEHVARVVLGGMEAARRAGPR